MCRGNHKYKCSKCRSPYCSIPCYKTHQQSCAGAFEPPKLVPTTPLEDQHIVKTDYLSDEELRIPQSQLSKLAKDEKLRQLLADGALREKLVMIDNSKQRMTEVVEAMKS